MNAGYMGDIDWVQGYEEWAEAQNKDYTTEELEMMEKESRAEEKTPAGNIDYNEDWLKLTNEISQGIDKLIESMYKPLREQEFWATVAKIRKAQVRLQEIKDNEAIEMIFGGAE